MLHVWSTFQGMDWTRQDLPQWEPSHTEVILMCAVEEAAGIRENLGAGLEGSSCLEQRKVRSRWGCCLLGNGDLRRNPTSAFFFPAPPPPSHVPNWGLPTPLALGKGLGWWW